MNRADMDELELFLLDFLAYRRGRKEPSVPSQPAVMEPFSMANIGKGWPHYKAMPLPFGPAEPAPMGKKTPAPHTSDHPTTGNPIVQVLTPIVLAALDKFGPPDTPHHLKHLTDQVIAKAMTLPDVAASMRTSEMKPWGRAALLQAVVEVLILSLASDKYPPSGFRRAAQD